MSGKYIIRLDDACPTMNTEKWDRIEKLLDSKNVKPIIGVIPNNEDQELYYNEGNDAFWNLVRNWQTKGYTIALHGYNHKYITNEGGLIPINHRSEFAGVGLSEQRDKIKLGIGIFEKHRIKTDIFFAPSHSLDFNTLEVLNSESKINIISDGFAFQTYYENGFYWIPQQFWRFRKMSFGLWTICIHPNTMSESEFSKMKCFIEANSKNFINFENLEFVKRQRNLFERLFESYYFFRRRIKNMKKGYN